MSSTLAKDAVPWLLAFMIVYCDRLFAFVMRKIRPAPRPRAANGAVVFSRASIRKQHTIPSFAPRMQEPAAANTIASTTASIAASSPTTELPAPGTNANGALPLTAPTPVASVASPPVNAYDNRPPVRPLLDANAVAISRLRTALLDNPLFDPVRHDELWLLRFLLSHKKSVTAAAKAARTCLQWRKEHDMDKLAAKMRATPGSRGATSHPVFQYGHRRHVSPGGMHLLLPDPQRGPILVGDMTKFDYNAAMEKLTREEYTAFARIFNEWFFNECDRVTRETGLLTKSARFVQCRDFSVRALNRDWLKMDGQVSKEMEDCYPQLLGLILVLDPPQWALIMWRAVKFLFPARMVEKVDLIPTSARKELERRVLRFVSLDDLPETHGGRRKPYDCPVHGPQQ